MKQMVVIDRQAGNRTIFMPESFEINFYDFGDMLFVNFCKVGEIHNMFSIQLLFDNDKLAADINRLKESEQKLVIKHLKEYIINDVIEFLSDDPDKDYYEIFPLEDRVHFDTSVFCRRWYVFYNCIIYNLDLHKSKGKKKKNKKSNKK